MKYVKMLGLLAVAASALMAFAGTASATLTNESGGLPGTLHSNSSGATSLTGTLTITCQKSTVGGDITTNDANEAEGPITTLTFTECGSSTVTVVQKGSLTLTDNDGTTATVYSKSAVVTVLLHNIFLGTVHCTYITGTNPKTHIGTLTESTHDPGTGVRHKTATLHISASITKDPETSSGACGTHATWEGKYEVSSPDELFLD